MLRRLALFGNAFATLGRRSHVRTFTTFGQHYEKALPPRPKVVETDLEESFLKGTGPGGQKINKTSSAVQLKHLPTGIVVKSQETRSREQNRKLARNVLAEKLDQLEKGDQSRTAIKAKRATAKKASADKKSRRKYRKLEEEKQGKKDAQGAAEGGQQGHDDHHGVGTGVPEDVQAPDSGNQERG